MNILLKLIHLLADGKFHSYQQCNEILGIKNTILKKHINTIRHWGIDVFTILEKGYRLYAPLQLLNKKIIFSHLPEKRITVLPVIHSTNQYLIEQIGFIKSGEACVAEYQAKGRGRRGRRWISIFGNNIYLSIYWCFNNRKTITANLSLTIAIVVAEVLHHFGAKEVRVKWPNDLYLNNRKLAGVLIDILGKATDPTHVIIGIGINLKICKYIKNWAYLEDAGIIIDRNRLISELTYTLRKALQQFEYYGFSPFFSRWKKLDNFLNKTVKLHIGNNKIQGIARGINRHGAFLLEKNGILHTHFGEEISLRICHSKLALNNI